MRKRKLIFRILAVTAIASILLTGCRKKKVEGPVEETLTAISLKDLVAGNFYVKSGDSYYLLPLEDMNYDPTKEVVSTDNSANGFVSSDDNRLLDFIYKDTAIPTLYKNDQLIYVSTDSINEFNWERYKDFGYSIGISGLSLTSSGKAKSAENTVLANGSSVQMALSGVEIPEGSDLTVDKINGTAITKQYVNDGGVITGMSMDATAQIDFYVGTAPLQVTASADTRYFKAFELYQTDRYSLSTDGYAIVEVPSYFKSGYYLINGTGFVKFLNVDRGVDESSIGLDTPYYYQDKDGKTLTFYEWQEANGITPDTDSQGYQQEAAEKITAADYPEKQKITIDNTQQSLSVTVAYKYINEENRTDASKNGSFPKVYLVDPLGNATKLTEDNRQTYGGENSEGYTYLVGNVEGAVAGDWYLLYDNFENTYKEADVTIGSGNATSYLHNGDRGSISIYYDASNQPHDFTVTWEKNDRSLKSLRLTAPDGTVYSSDTTPGNIMANEAGKYVVKVPNLLQGKYTFDIAGDTLGRVWVDCEISVALDNTQPAESTEETAESSQ